MTTVKMVAVDMDGTFLDDKKQYNCARFLACYHQLTQRHIKFVVASGNQYHQLRSFFPEIASEIAFVAENGALIIDRDQELFCGSFSRNDIDAVLDTLENGHYLICAICSADVRAPTTSKGWMRSGWSRCGIIATGSGPFVLLMRLPTTGYLSLPLICRMSMSSL